VPVPAAPQLALHSPGALSDQLLGAAGEVRIGGLQADARWEYSLDGGRTWLAGAGGALTPAALGPDGSKSLLVVQINEQGGRSPAGSLQFDMDTIAPAGPGLTLLQDSGASLEDGWTNDGTVRLDGLEVGARWQYSVDGGASWWNGVGSTLTSAQLGVDGVKDLLVRQMDPAGNEGLATRLRIVLDTQAADVRPTLVNDTGLSTTDGLTRDGTVRIDGLEPGLAWEYRIDEGPWVTGQGDTIAAAEFGTGQGERRVEVRHVDGAGNRGSAVLEFTLDTAVTAPTARLAVDSGVAGDGRTHDPTVLVEGLEAGALWDFQINGGEWRRGSGDRIDKSMFDGESEGWQTVLIRQVDAAGNPSDTALGFLLRRQADAPIVALVDDTGVAGDAVTRDGALRIGGIEPGGRWEYRLHDGDWKTGSGDRIPGSEFADVPDGAQRVAVRYTDAVGNQATSVLEFLLDRVATLPTLMLADDTGVAGDLLTGEGTLVVGGIEPGGSWTWRVDGGEWQVGSGDRIASPALDAEGAHQVEVRHTDVAGNIARSELTYLVDRTVAAPTVALVNDTGTAGDRITNDAAVAVSGIETGARWEYRLGNGAWQTGSGDRIAATEFGVEGRHTVEVRQTDVAGNQASTSLTFDLDRTVAAPTLALINDTGTAEDRITNDAAIAVSGIEAGAKWEYRLGNGAWKTGSGDRIAATEFGAEGRHTVEVRQTDAAGNQASASLTFDLDRTVAAPTVALVNDTGTAGDRITNDAAIAVSGIEAGAKWEYRLGSGAWKTGSGNRIAATEFGAEGRYVVEVRQTDVAGNQASTSLTFDLDRAMAAPTVALVNDTGTAGDRITNDAAIAVSGIEAGAKWEYRLGGGAWKTGSGNRIAATEFGAEGRHTVEVRQTDAAGNQASASLTFDLDRTVAAPTVALVNDTGTAGDRITNDAVIAVSGIEAGAKWEYRLGNGAWRTGSGNRIAATEFGAEGRYTVEVRQTDAAANQASSSLTFDLDRTVAAPTVALVNDTGVPGDGISRESTLQVGGIEGGASWVYRIDGGSWQQGASNGRISDAALNVEGTHQVEVRQTDAAGNSASATRAITTDRSVAAPGVALANDTGASDSDRITREARVSVSGLESGASWEYSRDGVSWSAGTGDTIAASMFAGDGAKRVLVRQTDAAGNVSAATELRFQLDTTVADPSATLGSRAREHYPLAGGIDFHAGQVVNGQTWLQLGLEDGATWLYSLNGGQDYLSGQGGRLNLDVLKQEGAQTIRVRQQDVAGNWSGDRVVDVVVDNTAPVVTAKYSWALQPGPGTPGRVQGFDFQASEEVQILFVPVGAANNGTADSHLAGFDGKGPLVAGDGTPFLGVWREQPGNTLYEVIAVDKAGNASFVSMEGDGNNAKHVVHTVFIDAGGQFTNNNVVDAAIDSFNGRSIAEATLASDHLFGSAAADTFLWSHRPMNPNSQADWVHDYDKRQGDVLEISWLPRTDLTDANIAKYLRKEVLADGTLSLWCDVDGKGETFPGNYDQRILVSALSGTELQIRSASDGASFVI